jgi:hypothetical protein
MPYEHNETTYKQRPFAAPTSDGSPDHERAQYPNGQPRKTKIEPDNQERHEYNIWYRPPRDPCVDDNDRDIVRKVDTHENPSCSPEPTPEPCLLILLWIQVALAHLVLSGHFGFIGHGNGGCQFRGDIGTTTRPGVMADPAGAGRRKPEHYESVATRGVMSGCRAADPHCRSRYRCCQRVSWGLPEDLSAAPGRVLLRPFTPPPPAPPPRAPRARTARAARRAPRAS